MIALRQERISTPIGAILLLTDGAECVRALDWQDCSARMNALLNRAFGKAFSIECRSAALATRAAQDLARYFAGEVDAINSINVAPSGSPFQQMVWSALRAIPGGATKSYGALAKALGRARAARAVGFANGANPISIVIPCHRLVGADGALTGYAGGIERKRWLLTHEGAI